MFRSIHILLFDVFGCIVNVKKNMFLYTILSYFELQFNFANKSHKKKETKRTFANKLQNLHSFLLKSTVNVMYMFYGLVKDTE